MFYRRLLRFSLFNLDKTNKSANKSKLFLKKIVFFIDIFDGILL